MKDEGHRNAALLRSFKAARGTNLRGPWAWERIGATVYPARGPSYGPKGHESIAQASAWVLYFQWNRPHKALPSSALLEKHPVRRVGGAEGAQKSSYATPQQNSLIFAPFGPVPENTTS
ncbi:MAG: hypothetical protein QOG92_2041 [Verrucomicrobiota bacterium]|jgi:hypothetical protein|nr:hypothetical protein [Verrucomicrobiota bacterium]